MDRIRLAAIVLGSKEERAAKVLGSEGTESEVSCMPPRVERNDRRRCGKDVEGGEEEEELETHLCLEAGKQGACG